MFSVNPSSWSAAAVYGGRVAGAPRGQRRAGTRGIEGAVELLAIVQFSSGQAGVSHVPYV